MPGTFIDVQVDPAAGTDPELAKTLEGVCPVDIFKAGHAGVEIVEHNLDAAPAGAVRVLKLYSGESLPA